MKSLYDRFGLQADLEKSNEMFRNKMNNVLEYGKLGSDIFDQDEDNILWDMCLKLGLDYNHYSEARELFSKSLNLATYFFRIQILLDHLWETKQANRPYAKSLATLIGGFLEESPLNLGYQIKIYKTKPPQIFPSKSKFNDKLVLDSLAILEDSKYATVNEHFEEALRELLKAKTKAQLKNVAEDLLTTCDNVVKVLYESQNLGFSHLFKEDRWSKVGLNSYQKNMFWQLNDWMDKIKHDVDKSYQRKDIDYMLSMVAGLIQLVLK